MVAALEVFDGQLYAGTWNDGGAQVWRTADGRTWTPLTPGWPPTKTGVLDLQVFGSYLYVGTDDESGGELWRTAGSAWEQVVAGGFGHAGNWGVDVLAVYSGTLYAATASSDTGSELWASPTGDAGTWARVSTPGTVGAGVGFSTLGTYGDFLYVGGSYDGRAALWRTDGVEWCTIFTAGLDLNNTHVSAMAVFQDQLYMGLRNTATGGEVWRSSDGQRWARIVVNGLES